MSDRPCDHFNPSLHLKVPLPKGDLGGSDLYHNQSLITLEKTHRIRYS
jgi:hypothetical protein